MTVAPDAHRKIRAEMVRCGYTMDTLSAGTQISPEVLRSILRGQITRISTRNLFALAHAVGYETSVFVDLLSGNAAYPTIPYE